MMSFGLLKLVLHALACLDMIAVKASNPAGIPVQLCVIQKRVHSHITITRRRLSWRCRGRLTRRRARAGPRRGRRTGWRRDY